MKEKRNIENFKQELLAKYLSNEVNSSEKLEVESWLNLSDKNREEMEENRRILRNVDAYYKAKAFNSEEAWNKVHSSIHPAQFKLNQRKNRRKNQFKQFYKYAAILVVAVLLGGVGYYFGFNKFPTEYTEVVSTNKQVLNEIVLPDGSLVSLNSNSRLEFPEHFASDVREVSIIGEGFFDVKPNPDKPFIINAGGTQIKVLGTSFNVAAYPESKMVEVIVKTGKVEVTRKAENLVSESLKVLLMPGEKGTLFYESKILQKTENNNINFLAWKTNDIIFNETPLKEVITCLENVYHIDIDILDTELEREVLSAHFNKKPIDFVLNVVRLTFDLELKGENEHYTLASRTNN